MITEQLTAARPAPGPGGHVVADQSEVVRFLARPATYGPGVRRVERIDTHGAMVFLAGKRAYKLKRAVRYAYMDFSTPDLRRAACAQEVALNRRTAPALYLRTLPVTRAADGALALDGAGEAIDWLVVMRRFEQDGLFDRLAMAGRLTDELMRALADDIAAFHEGAERLSGAGAPGGGSAGLAAVLEETIAELSERPDLFSPAEVAAFAAQARAVLRRVAALLAERQAEGFVRRCHGDLHLRNICLSDGRPTIFDAIEFNQAISGIDVFYDLAFLLMDLDHRNLRPFANLVLNRYLQHRGDLAGLAALPLFLSVRAAVRAKVNVSMAESQGDPGAARRLEVEAGGYFRAACAYLSPCPPRLVVLGGLSGSGKTSLARELAPGLGAPPGALHLRSDVLRKTRAGLDELTRLPPGAYGPKQSRAVYRELAERTRAGLRAARSVIADAVYARPVERQAIEAVARDLGVAFTGLWLEAPEEVLSGRVTARRGDASDADAAVVRRQLGYDIGELTWQRLDAAGARGGLVAAAEKIISY